MTDLKTLETTFDHLTETLIQTVSDPSAFTLTLNAEQTQFTRFNQARVRQTGTVSDAKLLLSLIDDQRTAYREIPCIGDWETDWAQMQFALKDLQQELPQLPIDPCLVLPMGEASSREVHEGQLLERDHVADRVLTPVQDLDFAGIYAAGTLVRAYSDSAGQRHWFATTSFDLDYSLFTVTGQAVKGTVAGDRWDADHYEQQIQDARTTLMQLMQPMQNLSRGQYRTYFAPAATAELIGMLNWQGISEAALQQGGSCLAALQRGDQALSSKFSLKENYQHGMVPRFNEFGDIAPSELTLITHGKLTNTLVSRRSAQEYGKAANGAVAGELLRSPEVAPGTLSQAAILNQLGTGLYVSNLHYLNWSDLPQGRVTGMTRYACFWVEHGEVVGPIANLRFDDSLYHFWGDGLVDLTDFQTFVPEISTYGERSLGGSWVPGMLVDGFTYTL